MSTQTLGEVDLFGFGDFGGLDRSVVAGAVVGGGGAALASMVVRYTTDDPAWLKYSEAVGLAVGGGVGALMHFGVLGDQYRPAGMPAILTAALTAGLRQLEIMFSKKAAARAVAPALSAPVVDYLTGMGVPQVEYLNGLGVATVGPVPEAYGTIPGVAGPALSNGAAPVDLLQAGTLPGAGNDVTLLGAPQPHGMASMYGATLFGSK